VDELQQISLEGKVELTVTLPAILHRLKTLDIPPEFSSKVGPTPETRVAKGCLYILHHGLLATQENKELGLKRSDMTSILKGWTPIAMWTQYLVTYAARLPIGRGHAGYATQFQADTFQCVFDVLCILRPLLPAPGDPFVDDPAAIFASFVDLLTRLWIMATTPYL
jgi:hypothetical protein